MPFPALAALVLAISAPVNQAPPAVVGMARAGEQVTGSSGTWSGSGTITYTYRWSRCDATGGGCAEIAGANLPTYLLTAADVGRTLGLMVSARDPNGSAVAYASLVGPVAPASALASVGRPTVGGTPAVGSSLTVSSGLWTASPTAITYAWLRCDTTSRACAPIAGATATSYTPVAADVGHPLVVRVQAAAGTSTQSVLSVATAAVAAAPGPSAPTAASARPTVGGGARVGQRLTGNAPAAATGTVAYQWYRCDAAGAHCSSIHGAVATTYTTVSADAGHTLGLTVKAATPAYASLVGPIVPAAAPAFASVQATVTGKPVQGQTLTAAAGTWSQAPSAVAYAWQRCNANGRVCAPIPGATSATYVPVAADVGHALAALVSVEIGAARASALSIATDAIVAPPALVNSARPTAAGTLQAGQRVTAVAGAWAGSDPIGYRYQWYRCDAGGGHCSSIRGATAPSYRLVAADAGRTIGLTVTASDASGARKPAYAPLLGPVAAASATLASVVPPRVTAQGQTLTVDAGAWTTTPSSTTVQWERCNPNGRVCAPIAGASAPTYTLTSGDAGHAVIALVTARAGAQTASALGTPAS